MIYDWGGGLIWAALPPKPDAQAALVRARVDAAGGHATLIRASEQVRRNVDVFHPQADGLAALERTRPPQLRSEKHPQPRPDDAGGCDMKTEFSLAQLADPDIAEADKILRACVHCGFCTATCPTYVLLGDELDSPRGRIYLIKEMLEKDRPPTEEVVKHIDRCLSCLACMTTCPSGVNYMHLVDQARVRIERDYVAAADRAGAARGARLCVAAAGLVSRQHVAGAARPAARRLAADPEDGVGVAGFIAADQGDAGAGAGQPAAAGACRRQRFSGHRRAARTGRAAAGLRPAGAGAAHQPGRHQSADAPRRRGRAGQGRAMLRRADPSSRARWRRAGARPRQHRSLARGGRSRAASTPSW